MHHRIRARGHMLLVAIVLTTLISVFLAMALEPANTAAVRQREAELIYRGEHLAAGIRRFYGKFGRFPFELEELIEEDPRFIRKLYPDPMTKSGEWTLVYLTATDQLAVKDLNSSLRKALNQAINPDQEVLEDPELNSQNIAQKQNLLFDGPKQQITGVRSQSEEEGLMKRDDSSIYADWLFTALPRPKEGLRGAIQKLEEQTEPTP